MELKLSEPPRRRIRWRACHRIIPSRFPPIDLFERVADAADLAAVHELESLTNDRLREERGEIALIPAADRVMGPGASYIMAPFAHPAAGGARFNGPQVGAFYAGRALDTAIAETVHHRTRFMRATKEPPMELDMRVLEAEVDARVHDIRGMRDKLSSIYDSDDYTASQQFASRIRAEGSDGVVYDSVRHEGGQCITIFRPRRIRSCRESLHLAYVWDGEEIVRVYEKREYPSG